MSRWDSSLIDICRELWPVGSISRGRNDCAPQCSRSPHQLNELDNHLLNGLERRVLIYDYDDILWDLRKT